MWQDYINASSIEDVLPVLASKKEKARVVAGATDLILEMERGVRKGVETLVDITRIPGLDKIRLDENNRIHIGPLVTHNHCVASKLIREYAFPLARASWEVGSPQIRNRGTVAGNVITASPANDTISPLMALDAVVVLQSTRGIREVRLAEFYTGVRRNGMQADEMLVDIHFPALQDGEIGTFSKFALRRAQAISLLNATVIVKMTNDIVEAAKITLGAVAPVIIHAVLAEEYLIGKTLNKEVIEHAAGLAMQASRPINDVRGSAGYRRAMVKVIVRRALQSLMDGSYCSEIPEEPIMLWGDHAPKMSELPGTLASAHAPIRTRINGKEFEFTSGHEKTLLRLLREEAGMTGTKEGCGEGECGACTVYLDGVAVMGCMVPAPRAHLAEITTVEGLRVGEELHPVQTAFVEEGAVQCGYCTPGFLMSAVKLLQEKPNPDRNQISQAITGNLCRCTGYYKIITAIEKAANKMT